MKATDTILYFAYGSNLVARQMRQRCPTSRPMARGYLDGWQIDFGGHATTWAGAVANVVHSKASWVEGVIYELTFADLRALDTYEGHPSSYIRRRLMVTLTNGQQRGAYVYVQSPESEGRRSRVSPRYFKAISNAYRRLGFDNDRLLQARAEHDAWVGERAEERPHRVFVYGSLLRGLGNDRLLRDAELECETHTEPGYELYNLGAFPAMVPGGSQVVYGEVYRVDGATLNRLDYLEGHPDYYLRTRVRLQGGDTVEAYLLDHDQVHGHERVVSGDWRDHAQLAWSWKEEERAN